jgi:rhodanese-related sulfurtransferase
MRPEIDLPAFAAAHADGAFVLDVREPQEYVDGHVPGAHLVPLAQVLARRAELPAGERVFVICASGNRSKSATDWLRGIGVEALSVRGGTTEWIAQGHPVVRGAHANESAA